MEVIKQHRAFNGAVKFYQHHSSSTHTIMKFSCYEPDATPRGIILWLSGLTCNEENFITKAHALEFCSQEKIVLVCPDTSMTIVGLS